MRVKAEFLCLNTSAPRYKQAIAEAKTIFDNLGKDEKDADLKALATFQYDIADICCNNNQNPKACSTELMELLLEELKNPSFEFNMGRNGMQQNGHALVFCTELIFQLDPYERSAESFHDTLSGHIQANQKKEAIKMIEERLAAQKNQGHTASSAEFAALSLTPHSLSRRSSDTQSGKNTEDEQGLSDQETLLQMN